MANHTFTHLEVHPNSPEQQQLNPPVINSPSASVFTSPMGPFHLIPSTPCPHQKRRHDGDPNVLDTPSKCMWLLGAALGSTSAGSILLSKAKVTHLEMSEIIKAPIIQHEDPTFPEPDWSLLKPNAPLQHQSQAKLEQMIEELTLNLSLVYQMIVGQRGIIEAANAQLLIQNLGMIKMNWALHEKEGGENKDRTVLKLSPNGKENAKLQEQADKASRKPAQGDWKAEKEQIEVLWKEMQRDHALAVCAWQEHCEQLKQAGAKKKDLLKKPKLALKPTLKKVTEDKEDNGDNEDGSESDSDDGNDGND
ncbi:hypothetical protein HYPSUDRAFT_200539 [Hypholoma sublateritium FD-334 SS-4]|uniref:Uncharacterized protein n=1 Tax=Hypholoma sublateritium (strain FD-334 SS-4) TaxID=945553 RepID=A0A0D2MLI3_HYPSF|nr:hypothetical protein HYPSUDRAFT_200539 [Hypholoma sublateritium FD-334 SS-4]